MTVLSRPSSRTIILAIAFLAAWAAWLHRAGIADWMTNIEDAQASVAITVASPTVHTRERLLNDRFEQVSWLERELDLTNPAVLADPRPDPPAPRKAEADKSAAPAEAAPKTVTASSQGNVETHYGAADDPLQSFELMNGFRDVLRAERARAMLDDRHDLDDNTLDLFSFDATVMPRTLAHGYAAVEVMLTREPGDLLPTADGFAGARHRLDQREDVDLFDIYVAWLEKIRGLRQSDLKSLTDKLDCVEILAEHDEYEATLRTAACAEFMRVLFPTVLPRDDQTPCRDASAGVTIRDRQEGGGAANPQVRHAIEKIDALLATLTWAFQTKAPADFLANILPYETPPERQRRAWGIANECARLPPDAQIDVVALQGINPVSRSSADPANPGKDFPCFNIPKNAAWRALLSMVTKLQESPKALPVDPVPAPPSLTVASLLPGLDVLSSDIAAFSTSCLAATLLEEGLVRPSADLPHNHGAALKDFFTIRVERLSTGCSLTLKPIVTSLSAVDGTPLLKNFNDRLEALGYGASTPDTPTTRAYGYSLSPRLRRNVEVKSRQNDATAISVGLASLGLGNDRSLDFQGVEAEVVGFSRPAVDSGERRMRGARFGWLISPQPGNDMTWSVPLEQAQLEAVVALPSWWRSALMQICTRFVPENAIAEMVKDAFWRHARQCRVEMIRLPGSAADVSRRLGMDVLTTPYMEEWKEEPLLHAGRRGEATHLLISGERLWRNTVVTLGGQKADRIEVPPDMVGITATFYCIRTPVTNPLPTSITKSPGMNYFHVPVVVWTSEGHTQPQQALIELQTGPSYKPCPAPGAPFEPLPDAPKTSTPPAALAASAALLAR